MQAAQEYLHKVADGKRTTGYADEDFIEGAKWQAGQMYSEEEVENILIEYVKTGPSKPYMPIRWFSEQKKSNHENDI